MSKADQNQTETELVDTVSTPDLEDQGSLSVNRRGFMRIGAGAAVAAGAAAHPSLSPVGNARAALPLIPIGAAVGGAALGYLVNEGVDYLTGDDRDYSGYTGGDALHQQIVTGAAQMAESDEITLTTIANNVEYSDNVALPKGKAAAVEAMNDGADQSLATSRMQEAIDDAFSVMQENLLGHWNSQVSQLKHHADQLATHDQISPSDVVVFDNSSSGLQHTSDGDGDPASDGTGNMEMGVLNTLEKELLNGDAADYNVGWVHKENGYWSNLDFLNEDDGNQPTESDYDHMTAYGYVEFDSSDHIFAIEVGRYQTIWDDLLSSRDRVNANLSTFISDLYNAYEPGDIPLEDVVDPFTAYSEMNMSYDESGYYGYAGASAATLGIPTTSGQQMFIYLEDSEVEVEAQLYTNYEPPEGSFEVDTLYNPANWDESVFISYSGVFEDPETGEVTEETDFVKLEQPFTINEMYDKEGTQIDSTSTESKNLQTADVEALRKELEQLRELQLEMQAESQESTGGGFDWDQFAVGGLAGEVVAGIGALVVSGLVGVGLISK